MINIDQIKEAINDIAAGFEKRIPFEKEKKKLEQKKKRIEKSIRKKDSELNKVESASLLKLNDILGSIKLYTKDQVKLEVLNTAKNSLKIKSGKVCIPLNDGYVFYLTQNRFAFKYHINSREYHDTDLDYVTATKDHLIYRPNWRDEEITVPIEKILEHKHIDKEYFEKFIEFLKRFEDIGNESFINTNPYGGKPITKSMQINTSYDYLNNSYIKINVNLVPKVEWDKKHKLNFNKMSNELYSYLTVLEKGHDKIKPLVDEIKEFNAGKNFLKKIR